MRRRVAAVVIIVVLVLLLIWGLVSCGGGKNEEPTPAASVSSSSSAAPTTESSSETTSASASESPSETTSSVVKDPNATCTLSDLIITARSDRPSYGPQDTPIFYMSVDNPTAADCEIDLDAQPLRFEVYEMATNRRVWADVDCTQSEATGKRVFEAGKATTFEAQWSRASSAPQQCEGREPVAPGGYFLHGVVGDNPSAAYTFNLG
ncbi:hypothetical protein L1O03_08265 [Corynebacterium uropygiale]|uniref:Uncharacterized protein n=1 Tax=Corynebacterium uropygiale TaxID=1775911 RepID=A0A9X1QS38_9CORY|nr:hypothetical protein [Corynebacterium uropygiale]MCF4007165.1 hypothetical protein [Corynebacterium uropygiale]